MRQHLLLAADAYLTGLSVTVLLVTYPGFSLVGAKEWATFHAHHSRAIGIAVGPAWALQGVLTFWWLLDGTHRTAAIVQAVFALLTVVTTLVGAVPAHEILANDRTPHALGRLRRWHGLRTICWLGSLVAAFFAL